ncbi:hypothetical protein [Simiduia agarivorans]|uniref:Signal transduction protein n=1 Tax=Simiduia agarivorans (strain DSM 21679 / JCM 13881 / BCRC 17597 / SA1) TaxID=1117647 RepID=K4L1I3_SIMAS|nr:hypothetical protein [Simiduia agarivorans]AFV00033.1 signal transduction protein [Simiduia agarivorans SA1 = DSM 21679]
MFALNSIKRARTTIIEKTASPELFAHSPALALFRDFRDLPPACFSGSTHLEVAAEQVIQSPYDFGLVVNSQHEILGCILESVLLLENRMSLQQAGFDLALMDARQLMKPLSALLAIELSAFSQLSVRKLAKLMLQKQLQELVIMDSASDEMRSIITLTQMRKLTHLALHQPTPVSQLVGILKH